MTTSPRLPPLKARKSARQQRSTQMVADIVDAGARILEERGFEGYTTNAIAARAGVSVGSLYQYFPGKDAITIALIDRELEILCADVLRCGDYADWRDGFARIVSACVDHQLRRPRLAALLDIEESRLDYPADDSPLLLGPMSVIQVLLGQAAGRPVDDPAGTALDIMAITRGLTDAAGQRGDLDRQKLMEKISRAVFGYLGVETAGD